MDGPRYFRKVIKIRAEDSPNVRYAVGQNALGLLESDGNAEPTYEEILPGVLNYPEYLKRRAMWDAIRQCVGLDAEFYEGAEVLLLPPQWLDACEVAAARLPRDRRAKSIGLDSAQGGDNTSWAAVDDLGLIELVSKKTGDTSVITGDTLAFMQKHGCQPHQIWLDVGGGGKQHADRLESQGYRVNLVAFGETASDYDRYSRRMRGKQERKEDAYTRYTFKNRRAELYGILRQLCDPSSGIDGIGGSVFGLPRDIINRPRIDGLASLRKQLAMLPLKYDGEGRMYLPPKNKRNDKDEQPTLVEMIGCSPDEADALVLATFGLVTRGSSFVAGGF